MGWLVIIVIVVVWWLDDMNRSRVIRCEYLEEKEGDE